MNIRNKIDFDPKKILSIVSQEFHIPVDTLLDPRKTTHNVTSARYTAMYLIRLKNPELSGARIEMFFNSKYASVKNAIHAVEGWIKSDRIFKLRFEICLLRLNMIKRTKPIGRPKKMVDTISESVYLN